MFARIGVGRQARYNSLRSSEALLDRGKDLMDVVYRVAMQWATSDDIRQESGVEIVPVGHQPQEPATEPQRVTA